MTKKIETSFIEKIKQQHVGKWTGTKGTDVVAISDTHIQTTEKEKSKRRLRFLFTNRKGKEYSILFE